MHVFERSPFPKCPQLSAVIIRYLWYPWSHTKMIKTYQSHIIVRCLPSFSWWRHQMETFSALLALCAGNLLPVNSPHKGHWRGALMIHLISVWINSWRHTREAGDLRRYRAHYDVIVMSLYSGNPATAQATFYIEPMPLTCSQMELERFIAEINRP